MTQTTIDPATHRVRQGWCATSTGFLTYCMRKAAVTVTDPSGTRDTCTQHAKNYAAYGPQQRIAR